MRESLYSKILDYLENTYGDALLNLILQNNIQSVDYKYCLKQFAESLSQHSLSFSFKEAKESQKKGNFNKAMLVVSELVRDHITALRKIQHIFDKINGNNPREVLFKKFRQFDPLEVGLENAPDVLRIIDIFINSWIKNNPELRVQYLDIEIQVDIEQKKNEVFERYSSSAVSSQEIIEQREIMDGLLLKQEALRDTLIVKIFELSDLILRNKTYKLETAERIQYQIELINPIFTVIFNDIITKPSDSVKVEM